MPESARRVRAGGVLASTFILAVAGCGSPASVNSAGVSPTSSAPSVSTTAGPSGDGAAQSSTTLNLVSPGGSTVPSRPSASRPADLALDVLVIVDLAVDWMPEHLLNDSELLTQQSRIGDAEARILEALGEHGVIRRQLHTTAQVSLAVDTEGFGILRALPEVQAVHVDTADPPG